MEQRIQVLPLVELLFSLCLGANSPGTMQKGDDTYRYQTFYFLS